MSVQIAIKAVESLLAEEKKLLAQYASDVEQSERADWEKEIEALEIALRLLNDKNGRNQAIELLR